jgi:N-acetylglucosaminylphosphatidylinositol deacetylase
VRAFAITRTQASPSRSDLPDNITLHWEPTLIADVVRPYALKHSINILLTFDTHGISGHPNHGSLPLGLAHLLNALPSPKPRLYTLKSVPLASKYIGPLAPLSRRVWLPLERLRTRIHHERPHVLVVISGIREYLTAHRAMRAHQSQLVWFRHLYVLFSRYMWVNEWTEFMEKPEEAV